MLDIQESKLNNVNVTEPNNVHVDLFHPKQMCSKKCQLVFKNVCLKNALHHYI